MIITYLKIDNLYGFHNSELDLSYSRKVSKSSIPYEYLPDRKSFNFKRVCIISGTNASGKTSLGRVICGIENFIERKTILPILTSAICNKDNPAIIEIEFVTPSDNFIHKLELSFIDSGLAIKKLLYISLPIGKNDSCYTMRNKLQLIKEKGRNNTGAYINSENDGIATSFEEFSSIDFEDMAWMFMFSENKGDDKFSSSNTVSCKLFNKILQVFDPSIASVQPLLPENKKNKGKSNPASAYEIQFHNNDKVLINTSGEIAGERESINRFSKGTYDAIKLTSFISRVFSVAQQKQKGSSCTHFLDEQMAYTHSNLEQHILNLIISKLSPCSQFFYTTHNYDILDMGLPVHSFLFMRKNGNYSNIIQPEKIFNKNDRNLSNYVKNDYFNTLPDTSKLDTLLWED